MSRDENEVTGEAVETWTICVPRPGAPTKGAIQGIPVASFELGPSAGDQLERTLRRLSNSVRRGRPAVYRGDRELLPERPEAEEERELLAAQATAADPAHSAAMFEAVSLKTLRRELVADIEAKRRELAEWDRRIEAASERYDREEAKQRALIEETVRHGQRLVRESQSHYEARLRNTWETEAGLEEHNTAQMQQFGVQIQQTIQAKQQIDRIMRAQTAGELLGSLKGHLEVALNSPLGQAIQSGIAARWTAKVSNHIRDRHGKVPDPPITPDDVLATMVLQGRAFNARLAMLHELRVHAPASNQRPDGLLLGAHFVRGAIELAVVAEYVKKGTE